MAYTRTRYDHCQPAIFESHYPSMDAWSGYTSNYNEHYLHLTYVDNVLPIYPELSLYYLIHSKYDLSYYSTGATSQWNICDTMV
jgi:hypothetical protein